MHISSSDLSDSQSAKVVNYAKGLIHEVSCYSNLDDASKRDISVSRQLFAHRSIPEIFVQQFKIDNPSGQDQYFTGKINFSSAGLQKSNSNSNFLHRVENWYFQLGLSNDERKNVRMLTNMHIP